MRWPRAYASSRPRRQARYAGWTSPSRSSRPGAFDDADAQQLTLLADALTGALRHADAAARNRDLLDRADRERQRLQQSERRFAEVFDHSPVAKMVLGLRGAERGKIMLANPAFSLLL